MEYSMDDFVHDLVNSAIEGGYMAGNVVNTEAERLHKEVSGFLLLFSKHITNEQREAIGMVQAALKELSENKG